MGAAYQSAFARAAGPVASNHGYQHPDGGDDDGGFSSGETAAIAVGASAALGAGLYFSGVLGCCGDEECEDETAIFPLGGPVPNMERLPELTDAREPVAKLRLVPCISSLSAGYGVKFYLEAKSASTGRWFSVTGQPGAEIVVKRETPLVKLDGVRGAFGLPVTTPRSADGQKVEVVGTYAPAGQKPLRASEEFQLVVPGV